MEPRATTGNHTESASVPKISSIFKAETHAIYLALSTISATEAKNFSIFTDSRSCLQAHQKRIPTHQNVRKLKHTIASIQNSGKKVELCRILGHIGFPGDKMANKKISQGSMNKARRIDSVPLSRPFSIY